MGFLRAELVVRVRSRERFGELAGDWFTRALAELLPEFDRGLRAGPTLAGDDQIPPDAPMGPPGGAAGMLVVQPQPVSAGGRRTQYTERAWRRMLAELADTYPFHARIGATALDERGRTADPYHHMAIGVHRLHGHPDWVRFTVAAGLGSAGEPEGTRPYPGQRRWAEFIKAWADTTAASYAHVTDEAEGSGGTALENATFQRVEDTVPRCREVLRGYSWVTVCAAELSVQLGGEPALTATGAFDEVSELAGGQVFLRATPEIQQYQGATLRRVFEVLAPVLLAGRPHPMSGATARGRLVPDADATDYR